MYASAIVVVVVIIGTITAILVMSSLSHLWWCSHCRCRKHGCSWGSISNCKTSHFFLLMEPLAWPQTHRCSWGSHNCKAWGIAAQGKSKRTCTGVGQLDDTKQLNEAEECLNTGHLAGHLHNDAVLADVNGPHAKLVREDVQQLEVLACQAQHLAQCEQLCCAWCGLCYILHCCQLQRY